MEIARPHDLHPTTVPHWKHEFLENGRRYSARMQRCWPIEKKIREMEQLLGRKEVGAALTRSLTDGSS